MKTWCSGNIAALFLTLAQDGSEWSVSRRGHFIPGTLWIRGCAGPKFVQDATEKKKSLAPARNRTPEVQPISCSHTDWAILTCSLNLVRIYYIVAYSREAEFVESQQRAVTRQRPVNNIGMVVCAQSVQMAEQATMEYVMQLLSSNYTATEERCFLRGPCWDVISKII
jgi:hypothetical protein